MAGNVYNPGPPSNADGRPVTSPPEQQPSTGPGRTTTWMLVALAALAIAVVVLIGRVRALEGDLEQLAMGGPGWDDSAVVAPVTLAPPIDLPPSDGPDSTRSIVEAHQRLFGADSVESRLSVVIEPGALVERFNTLAGSPCAEVQVVVTDVRFVDDDTATVQFRFTGEGLPPGGDSFVFDSVARRVDGAWMIEPDAVTSLLDLSAPSCGITTTTLG